MRTKMAAVAGVAVMTVAGFGLTPAAPARADCLQYIYPNDTIVLSQDNGVVVTSGMQQMYFRNPISYESPGVPAVTGNVKGSVYGGNKIKLNAVWDNGFTNDYVGSIDQNGNASGTTVNNLGTTNEWILVGGGFTCRDEKPLYTATISARTDLYEEPNGTIYSWLERGTPVSVVNKSADGNWLAVTGPQVPKRTGWVKPDFVIPD